MARFRAHPGLGRPSIGGQELQLHSDGTFHVHHPAAIDHMRATGFEDADAPPKPGAVEPAPAPANNNFRAAVAKFLGLRGVSLPADAPDAQVGNALVDHLDDLSGKLQDATGANDTLRQAVAGALGEHGVSVPAAAPTSALVEALGNLKGAVAGKIAAAELATEERVLQALAEKKEPAEAGGTGAAQ